MRKIGMIGIGMMGHGIASNLQRCGYDLALFEHSGNQPLEALKKGGAKGFSDARELAKFSDIVILVLNGSSQVESVLTDKGGLLKGLSRGSVVIDCSTSMPASMLRMAEFVRSAGCRFLEAPMTRTPKEAAEGRLNLLVGGDADLLKECEPILSCFAENITHTGPTGSGHSMKLIHNFVSLGMISVLAEAAACAQSSGVEPAAFLKILDQGGGAGIALERLRPFILNQDPSGLMFSINNAHKDLSYYNKMIIDMPTQHKIAVVLLSLFDGVVQDGFGEKMVPELIALLNGGSELAKYS